MNTTNKQIAQACDRAGEECTMPREVVQEADGFPMQPVVIAKDGIIRFKENRIVRALLDYSLPRGYGLNEIARGDFTVAERMQLAQLIGYSVDGYGTLSYVTDESFYVAAEHSAALAQTKEQQQ